MRHEIAIQLDEHRMRGVIENMMPANPVYSDELFSGLMIAGEFDDYEINAPDFVWPEHWSEIRRAMFMFACNSEFQMTGILDWLIACCPSDKLPMLDKVTMYVAGIQAR